ncbi:MAG: radical SAM family heme chaperone HemW [Planctomycetota bacterium]|jgi:oxygen-independent coproporphyrinogen-3 oxidase
MKRIEVATKGQRVDSRRAFAAPGELARSLYVHIPFCDHKCHYCDFYSIVADSRTQAEFVEGVCRELEAQSARAGRLSTIYVGGGTPTLLSVASWGRILGTIHRCFDVSALEEFTVESNPDTSDARLLELLGSGGVNRLSVGVQSLEPALLRFLERTHDPENVERALERAAEAGIERRSVDLIFAIPGQTMAIWERDLERAMLLATTPGHISCYALTYEEGTALTQRVRRGETSPIGEDIEIAMLDRCVEMLGEGGFDRYEVSNFARPGESGGACAHNMAYWRCESCLAVGPSASGYLRDGAGGWRWTNSRSIRDWHAGVTREGYAPVDVLETPCASRRLCERLMLGVRIAEGFDSSILEEAKEAGWGAELALSIESALVRGQLVEGEGRLRPTQKGLRVADALASELMGAVERASRPSRRV